MRKRDLPVCAFASASALGDWLSEHHARSPGFWLKIPKKGSGEQGPTYVEAVAEALRFGWIDSQKDKLDDAFYLQRLTPRTARSKWSKINRETATALIAAGRMEPAGQAQVDAARKDGRWDAAYDSQATATVPPDFQEALDQNPAARAFFEKLNSRNRFAMLYRIQEAKREATRTRRIETFVAMCERGEPIY
ncbi:MAG: YdeI/OmpD-associated family protein [Deltaproteobacteria bacterium]|nr:YdeI/OmpD-associated family protein [Deltaproteobacteria bacterium]